MSDKDGKPAFPGSVDPIGEFNHHEGMSLRDWFAGMALQTLDSSNFENYDDMIFDAFIIADKCLKKRKDNDQ